MENYERSGRPKETITDENTELVHSPMMCGGEEACVK